MLTRADLEQFDRDDPLAPFRDRFALPPDRFLEISRQVAL